MYLEVWPDGSLESLTIFVRTLRMLVDTQLVQLIESTDQQLVRIYTSAYPTVRDILDRAGLSYRIITPGRP